MKLFNFCFLIAGLLIHGFTSFLAFASPPAGSSSKDEKEPSSLSEPKKRSSFDDESADSDDSSSQQKQKRLRSEQPLASTQTQQPVRFHTPRSSHGISNRISERNSETEDKMELESGEALTRLKQMPSSSSTVYPSSSSSSSSSEIKKTKKRLFSSVSSSSSTQVNPLGSSSSPSTGLDQVLKLPSVLLSEVRKYLTEKDLGHLKHLTSYNSSRKNKDRPTYNLDNLNHIQKYYREVSLQNRQESMRELLSGLLPVGERKSKLDPSSTLSLLPSEYFASSQKLELQPSSSFRSLNLSGTTLQHEDLLFIVTYFPDLEHLTLYYDYINPDAILLLSQLNKLKTLDISTDCRGDEGAIALAEVLKFTPNLTSFHIDIFRGAFGKDDGISEEGVTALANALEFVPELILLKISGNGDDSFGDAGAIALANALTRKFVPKLTSLDLRNNTFGDAGAIALAAALEFVPELTSLEIGQNRYFSQGVIALANALKFVPKLTFLEMSGEAMGVGGIGVEEATTLASALKSIPKLVSLDLSSNNIGMAGAIALAQALTQNPLSNLSSLDLSGNGIGSNGVIALAQTLIQNPLSSLTSLSLRLNDIGPDGAISFAQALTQNVLSNLTSLNLSGNKIGSEGAIALAQALARDEPSNPISLELSSNNIDSAGATALSNALKFIPKLNYSFTYSPTE